MRIRSVLRFSWKNLWTHRLRTILTVGGVSIGISAIVFLVSLGFGLEALVTSQVANFEAFTMIDIPSANLKSGKINQQAVDKLLALPHVKVLERIVDLAGRVRLGGQNSTTETVVVGVQPSYFDLADLPLAFGKLYTADAKDQVIISQSLANLLGFEQNTQSVINKDLILDLIVAKGLRVIDETDGPIVREGLPVKVVGVTTETASPTMYLSYVLAESQGVVNSTSVKLKVDDRNAVATVRQSIENLGFFTEYVGDTVTQITQVFSIFRIVLGAFGTIALVVAALGTFNTLTISLMERIREVSLLKMLGMKRPDVFKLFISESLTIGILGGVFGTATGLGIGAAANFLIRYLAQRAHAEPVSLFSTPIQFVLIMTLGSVLVGFFTGFYPTYRAIKTNPLDALRYE